ncbi:MAG: monoamine oxidase [Isosphaeraceae bacterium]|nr:MAG: monoamine oxidase [Isosphaeraceae bacterium]
MSTTRDPEILLLGDLRPGDQWRSPGRTITQADVVAFAGISGDFNPIHMDHEFAQSTPFGKPIAHGLLGLAIASGLGSHSPRVDTVAFLQILEWKFLEPIYFGDTVHLISRVVSVEPRGVGRRGVVTWHRQLVNQRGRVVQEGQAQTIVRSAPAPQRNRSADASPETTDPS